MSYIQWKAAIIVSCMIILLKACGSLSASLVNLNAGCQSVTTPHIVQSKRSSIVNAHANGFELINGEHNGTAVSLVDMPDYSDFIRMHAHVPIACSVVDRNVKPLHPAGITNEGDKDVEIMVEETSEMHNITSVYKECRNADQFTSLILDRVALLSQSLQSEQQCLIDSHLRAASKGMVESLVNRSVSAHLDELLDQRTRSHMDQLMLKLQQFTESLLRVKKSEREAQLDLYRVTLQQAVQQLQVRIQQQATAAIEGEVAQAIKSIKEFARTPSSVLRLPLVDGTGIENNNNNANNDGNNDNDGNLGHRRDKVLVDMDQLIERVSQHILQTQSARLSGDIGVVGVLSKQQLAQINDTIRDVLVEAVMAQLSLSDHGVGRRSLSVEDVFEVIQQSLRDTAQVTVAFELQRCQSEMVERCRELQSFLQDSFKRLAQIEQLQQHHEPIVRHLFSLANNTVNGTARGLVQLNTSAVSLLLDDLLSSNPEMEAMQTIVRRGAETLKSIRTAQKRLEGSLREMQVLRARLQARHQGDGTGATNIDEEDDNDDDEEEEEEEEDNVDGERARGAVEKHRSESRAKDMSSTGQSPTSVEQAPTRPANQQDQVQHQQFKDRSDELREGIARTSTAAQETTTEADVRKQQQQQQQQQPQDALTASPSEGVSRSRPLSVFKRMRSFLRKGFDKMTGHVSSSRSSRSSSSGANVDASHINAVTPVNEITISSSESSAGSLTDEAQLDDEAQCTTVDQLLSRHKHTIVKCVLSVPSAPTRHASNIARGRFNPLVELSDRQRASAAAGASSTTITTSTIAVEVYLLGTLHVSNTSAAMVERALHILRPQVVCLELCPQRFQELYQRQRQGQRQGQGHGQEQEQEIVNNDDTKSSQSSLLQILADSWFGLKPQQLLMELFSHAQRSFADRYAQDHDHETRGAGEGLAQLGREQAVAAKVGLRMNASMCLCDRGYEVTVNRLNAALPLWEKLKGEGAVNIFKGNGIILRS